MDFFCVNSYIGFEPLSIFTKSCILMLDSVLNKPPDIPKRNSWIIVAIVVKKKRMPYLAGYESGNQNNLSLMKMFKNER